MYATCIEDGEAIEVSKQKRDSSGLGLNDVPLKTVNNQRASFVISIPVDETIIRSYISLKTNDT